MNKPYSVQDVLAELEYRDGWSFRVVQEEPANTSYLQVVAIIDGCPQYGRKWRLSPHMTKSEVVQTAFKAVLTFEEHEARENFRYRGRAVFGPHIDVDALLLASSIMDVRGQP